MSDIEGQQRTPGPMGPPPVDPAPTGPNQPNHPVDGPGKPAVPTADPPAGMEAINPPPGPRGGEASPHGSSQTADTSRDIATGHGCVVALRFRDPLLAQEALLAAVRLHARKRLGLQDAAIVAKHKDKVRIQQTKDIDAVQGASSGLWLGVLAGLFVPGGILIGGALGAAAGGLFGKLRDIGIADDRMKELGEQLDDGQAALFMLIDDAHRAHVGAELRRFDATLFYATLDQTDRDWVEEALIAGRATSLGV